MIPVFIVKHKMHVEHVHYLKNAYTLLKMKVPKEFFFKVIP